MKKRSSQIILVSYYMIQLHVWDGMGWEHMLSAKPISEFHYFVLIEYEKGLTFECLGV